MSRDDAVRIDGLGALVRALKELEGGIDDLKTANQAASRIVLTEAQHRAPRRTGALANSGRVNRAAKKANVIFGNARVPYANPIHWGWPSRHIKAQPFVTSAADATRDDWLAEYEKNLQQLCDDVKGA